MESILQILIFFILAGTLLKLSFWKFWQACLFGLLCGAFVVISCRLAVLQSKTALADLLENIGVMRDAAVAITVETALALTYCFARLRTIVGNDDACSGTCGTIGKHDTDGMDGMPKWRWMRQLLHYYPGLLIFPVLFYLQTLAIFAMPGSDFTMTSWLMAVAVCTFVPLLSYAIRRLCPTEELRTEACFLVGIFVCVIGLVATVNGNVIYAAVKEAVNVQAIALAAGIFFTLFIAGLICNKLKWNKKWK